MKAISAPKDYMDRLDKLFGRVGTAIAAHPLRTVLVLSLCLVASSYYAMQVRIDNSFDTLFDESDEAYVSYRTYQRDFGSDEVAYIMYSVEGREHGLFDLETMRLVQQLTEELEYEVPFVREITSPTNVEFIVGHARFGLKREKQSQTDDSSFCVCLSKLLTILLQEGAGRAASDRPSRGLRPSTPRRRPRSSGSRC